MTGKCGAAFTKKEKLFHANAHAMQSRLMQMQMRGRSVRMIGFELDVGGNLFRLIDCNWIE